MKIQKRTHLICTIIYKLSHSLTLALSLSLSIYKSAIADDLQFNFHSGSTHEVIFLLLYILLITVYFRDQTQCLKSLDFS